MRYSQLAFILCLITLATASACADGILLPTEHRNSLIVVPDQLFTVRYHKVDVTIEDQLCTTKVDQIFHNDSGVDREGIYVFPMPRGSAITKFSMYAGEQEVRGKILGKSEARSIYESIVRSRKDPAILEYIDRDTFRASVYPIPAHGDKRIRLSYAEVASRTGQTCRYVYPLSTERFSAKPLEDCKVTIKIRAKHPISNIYSPTHMVDVDHVSANEATVTWEAKDTKPDTDMVLYYTISSDDMGIDIVAHREPGEKGYYMLLASPRVDLDKAKVQPKSVVFVLDRTGSMAGEKIDQAKDALKFCLNSLKSHDRFNVIIFNESPNPVFDGLRKVDADTRRKALDEVASLDADGGTNIDEALKKALGQFAGAGSSRNYIVFLTDGQPTVGETSPDTILRNAKSCNKNSVKLFSFGVGYDVNTHLLDKLAEQSRGDTDYVRPRESIEVKVSSFFAKVSEPLLSDVKLAISGVKTQDAFPSGDLPDIFKGSQLVVLGRYQGQGDVKVELSGIADGSRRTFTVSAELPGREESNEFIPQLWASRKIGYLLDEIRLHSNRELVDEVVRLSMEYGIPTEFTSFLADERGMPLEAALDRARAATNSAFVVKSGSYGVAQSANSRNMKNQAQVASADSLMLAKPGGPQSVVGTQAANGRMGGYYLDANDQLVAVANVQNVARRTFYQRGGYWEDANVKADQKYVQVKQFSDAHFRLLKAYPRLSQYSTLGNVRLVLENNQAIEIGPTGKEKMTDAEVESLLKDIPVSTRNSRASIPSPLLAAVAIAASCAACVPAVRARKRRG